MTKRQEKYPDTDTFKYYNANPKNRLGADCAIRAICTAMGSSWERTIREMTEVGIELGYTVNDPKTINEYLKRNGWTKQKQAKHSNGTKYRGEEFCDEIVPSAKPIIANMGSQHMVCIKNRKVYDIWDCTGRTVGNYWTK